MPIIIDEMKNGWTERIKELEAENRRLRMYRDAAESRAQGLEVERDAAVKWLEEYKSKTYCAYCGAIFNIDSDASHVSEHIRTCPHHPMRELEAENDELRAERDRLRELVDGATEVVEISNFTFPAQREWKAAWLKKAAKAMKEARDE